MFDVIHNCHHHKTPGNVKHKGILDITLSSPFIFRLEKFRPTEKKSFVGSPEMLTQAPGESSDFQFSHHFSLLLFILLS